MGRPYNSNRHQITEVETVVPENNFAPSEAYALAEYQPVLHKGVKLAVLAAGVDIGRGADKNWLSKYLPANFPLHAQIPRMKRTMPGQPINFSKSGCRFSSAYLKPAFL